MFCPNCGNNCGDANFCSNCGYNLKRTVATVSPADSASDERADMVRRYEKYMPNKLAAVKALRADTGMGLKEAVQTIDDLFSDVLPPSQYTLKQRIAAEEMIEAANAARQYEREKGYVPAQAIASAPETFDVDKLAWYPGKKKDERKAKITELEKSGQVYCPKCLSTSISANQKGFGFARGAIGAAVGLDVGLIAGGIGSKKVICTCLKCGYQWKAGKK